MMFTENIVIYFRGTELPEKLKGKLEEFTVIVGYKE